MKGTDTNEQMTEWRMMANRLTPPEVKREAETFIKENATSPISAYLLRKHFIDCQQPDYKKVICVPAADAIDAKVYIIEDPAHVTMLLAEEY